MDQGLGPRVRVKICGVKEQGSQGSFGEGPRLPGGLVVLAPRSATGADTSFIFDALPVMHTLVRPPLGAEDAEKHGASRVDIHRAVG